MSTTFAPSGVRRLREDDPAPMPPPPGGGLDEVAAARLLERTVATPSLSGGEREVAALLVAAAQAQGASAHIDDAGNAVAVWGDGPLRVTFLGHMDTVPGDIAVRVEDGVLHGRGAVDAKGSLCAALVAGSRLPSEVLEDVTFTVVGAVEEEAPSSRGARHAAATLPRPDLVIIGEPSGWDRYTLGYKGRLGVELRARLDCVHSSREEATAPEAVLGAFKALKAWVEEHANAPGSAPGQETSDAPNDTPTVTSAGAPLGQFDRLQIALLRVNSASDGLTDECQATVAFRLPPRWSAAELKRHLSALLAEHDVTARFTDGCDAHRASNRSELARAFRVAIRGAGAAPVPVLKTGTSDMNVVAPVWDVPMVAYGPGDSNLDHTPDERLALADYERAACVLVRVLTDLAGAGHPH